LTEQRFDQAYIDRLAGGDAAVQEHFGSYFSQLMVIKLRRQVRSRELVEDVVQETLLRVLRIVREKGLEHPERLGAFVNTVCSNVLKEQFRKEQRHQAGGLEEEDAVDSSRNAEELLVSEQNKLRVRSVLNELGEKDRSLLKLTFFEERDKDQICRHFGVNGDYLRVLLHRAKHQFRKGYLKPASPPIPQKSEG
jgi:RNA polymerase sigma-70 factor, ECF subfamily